MEDRGRSSFTADDVAPKKATKKSGSSSMDKEEIRKAAISLLNKNKGELKPKDIQDLYAKYGDSVADEILNIQRKINNEIKKKAKKIAAKVYNDYNSSDSTLHQILDRMMRYKTKNDWSDYQYDQFRKELSYLLTGSRAKEIANNPMISINRSKINRAIGTETVVETSAIKIKDSDQPYLAEILSMHETFKTLHQATYMFSLMYEDCSISAMSGQYKRDRHIASNFIHPLYACMWLPKFEIFEIMMIYASFGSLIKSRSERKPFVSEADSLLFEAITTDPNDVACDLQSPMADIRNRYKYQVALWETINKLRNGNYYDTSPALDLDTKLNTCRNNVYDNADAAYGQDEVAMLRRIMSVFSLRPTIIATKPVGGIGNYGFTGSNMFDNTSFGADLGRGFGSQTPFGLTGFPGFPGFSDYKAGKYDYPFNSQAVTTITSIPMINVRLPPNSDNATPLDLRTVSSQTLWLTENKRVVPKDISVVYSKEVLIFAVNRRIQPLEIRTFSNPLPFSQLPLTMTNFEKLNKYPISVPEQLVFGTSNEYYQLRSVVAVNETEIKQGNISTNIITGCTGLIMKHRDTSKNVFGPTYYLYDPFGASLPVQRPGGEYVNNKPISLLDPFTYPSPDKAVSKGFHERASSNGTIYFYAKSTGYNPREMISFAQA